MCFRYFVIFNIIIDDVTVCLVIHVVVAVVYIIVVVVIIVCRVYGVRIVYCDRVVGVVVCVYVVGVFSPIVLLPLVCCAVSYYTLHVDVDVVAVVIVVSR